MKTSRTYRIEEELIHRAESAVGAGHFASVTQAVEIGLSNLLVNLPHNDDGHLLPADRCQECGCTLHNPCIAANGHTCAWVNKEHNLCSFCAPKVAGAVKRSKEVTTSPKRPDGRADRGPAKASLAPGRASLPLSPRRTSRRGQ